LPIAAEPRNTSATSPPTKFSRSCKNRTDPPPMNASSDSTMPAITISEIASTRRLRANSTRLHAIGGSEDAISA
jgi:hypothetical protein